MEQTTDRALTKSGASALDTFVAVLLASLIYLPGSSTFNFIRLGVVAVIFVFKFYSTEPDKELNKVAICMALSPVISGGIVFVMELGTANTTLIVHEFQRMVFCAMLIVTVRKLELNFRIIYLITILVLIPNFIIQVLQYFQTGWVFDFIQNNYVFEDANEFSHLDLAREEYGEGLRCGSIFVNPNVYMAIPLYALVVFLHKDQERKGFINYALIVCAVISGLITGSRTATVAMAIILGIYIFRYANYGGKIIFVLAALFVAYRYGSELITTRAFDLDNATEGSLGVKINQFGWYFSSTSILYWLTGSLGSQAVLEFDSEIGHVFGWYGLFGIYWYFKYFQYIWKYCNEKIVFYNKPLVYISILVAITASVLLCMPIYPFVALVLFSDIDTKTNNEIVDLENGGEDY